MTKDQVMTIRDMIRNMPNNTPGQEGNSAIFIIADNLRLFNGEYHFLKWDDAKEILYVFMSPEYIQNRGAKAEAPIQIIATAYEHIQYIGGQFTSKVLKDYYKSKLGLDERSVKQMIMALDPNKEQMIKSLYNEPELKVLEKEDEYTKQQLEYDHNRPRDIDPINK